MAVVELGELLQKVRQVDPEHLERQTFAYIDISAIDRTTKRIVNAQELKVADAPSRARQLVRAGDVVVSTVRPNLNAVAEVTAEYDGEIASTGFCVVRPISARLDSTYLFYFVQTEGFISHLVRQSTGAGYPAVTDVDVTSSQIPLPPMAEQQRIAGLLQRADRLRRLRRYALAVSAGYLQAVFVEMFGDPVRNPKKLSMGTLQDVCDTRLGKMLDAKQQTGVNPRLYLRNVNVQRGRIDLTDLQEMDFDDREREILRLRKGDVLVCEGGKVGRTAIWNDDLPECYFQKALHRIRPSLAHLTPEYILWLMYCLAQGGGFDRFASQATIAHLTGIELKQLQIPLPPLAEQVKFSRIVQQFGRIRSQQEEAARQAEHLFQTLLQRAFGGKM